VRVEHGVFAFLTVCLPATAKRGKLVGISTHIGKVAIDPAHHQLIFDVEVCSFPNWEGKRQLRDYTYKDGVLSYAVTAYGDGTTAYSVWRRITE
jgi:hypothetical protein